MSVRNRGELRNSLAPGEVVRYEILDDPRDMSDIHSPVLSQKFHGNHIKSEIAGPTGRVLENPMASCSFHAGNFQIVDPGFRRREAAGAPGFNLNEDNFIVPSDNQINLSELLTVLLAQTSVTTHFKKTAGHRFAPFAQLVTFCHV